LEDHCTPALPWVKVSDEMSWMSAADLDLPQRGAAHPFFAGMTARQIQILAACADSRSWAACEIIFRAGDPAKGLTAARGKVLEAASPQESRG